jgi:hypothetical protein
MSASIGSVQPPTTVWLVREGDPNATEGTLSIEGHSLTFAPADEDSEKIAIPIAGIRKARRRRGTPVLGLSYTGPDGMRRLFIYFAKPPPLPGTQPRPPSSIFRSAKAIERSAAARALQASSRVVKREIEAWVRALRAAGAEG